MLGVSGARYFSNHIRCTSLSTLSEKGKLMYKWNFTDYVTLRILLSFLLSYQLASESISTKDNSAHSTCNMPLQISTLALLWTDREDLRHRQMHEVHTCTSIGQTMMVHAHPSVLLEDHHAEECHTPEYHTIGNKNHYAQDSVIDVISTIQQRAAPCYEPYAGIFLRIGNHKCF